MNTTEHDESKHHRPPTTSTKEGTFELELPSSFRQWVREQPGAAALCGRCYRQPVCRSKGVRTFSPLFECRATLCRVELEHRNPEQQLAFEQHFRFKVGAILPRMMLHSEEQQDGTISAVIYLAREGHDLPRPIY